MGKSIFPGKFPARRRRRHDLVRVFYTGKRLGEIHCENLLEQERRRRKRKERKKLKKLHEKVGGREREKEFKSHTKRNSKGKKFTLFFSSKRRKIMEKKKKKKEERE